MAESWSSASTSGHAYSPLWFHTFLQDTDPAITNHEVAFVQRRMPPASHPRVLDLCCGPGRHLGPLAAAGYEVTGLDIDSVPLADSRARAHDVVRGDMRCLPLRDRSRRRRLLLAKLWPFRRHDQSHCARRGCSNARRILARAGWRSPKIAVNRSRDVTMRRSVSACSPRGPTSSTNRHHCPTTPAETRRPDRPIGPTMYLFTPIVRGSGDGSDASRASAEHSSRTQRDQGTRMPVPSCPFLPDPQQYVAPSAVSAHM